MFWTRMFIVDSPITLKKWKREQQHEWISRTMSKRNQTQKQYTRHDPLYWSSTTGQVLMPQSKQWLPRRDGNQLERAISGLLGVMKCSLSCWVYTLIKAHCIACLRSVCEICWTFYREINEKKIMPKQQKKQIWLIYYLNNC